MFYLHLDFGIDSGWKREVLKALDGLWCSVADIDETLVDFHFESFTTGFVDVWGFDNGESAAFGWKGDWARDASAGANSGV